MASDRKYMPEVARPIPAPDPTTAPFWKAASEGRLEVQRCGSCKKLVFYPRPICPGCGSRELSWEKLQGVGVVYTYTVVYRPAHPGMAPATPYVVAIVELEEGARIMTNIVDCDPRAVSIGMEVEVVFEKLSDEVCIPLFRPRSS